MLDMRGHNSAGLGLALTFEQRCALALQALYGPEPLPQKVIKAAHYLQCDANTGELFVSKKDMRALLSMSKEKTIRGHRDSVYDEGFLEIEGKRGAKGAKSVLSEEEITAAVEAYRQGTSGTPSQGTSGTPGVPQVPHNGVPQVPPPPPEVPHQQGASGTPSSCVRVSYTGNIKNIPLPRACESWRSFVLIDGNLGITDVGLRFWMGQGMDEARIDLALLEADGKLSNYDRKTADGVEKKAGLFFSRNLQEKLDRDARYEAAAKRNAKDRSRSKQEELKEKNDAILQKYLAKQRG